MSDHAAIVREFFDDAENAENLHGFVLPMYAPRAALDALVAERDEAWQELDSKQRQISELVRTARSEQVRANNAEAERDAYRAALKVIASKRCLNASTVNPESLGSCDWPCVVCVARAALRETT